MDQKVLSPDKIRKIKNHHFENIKKLADKVREEPSPVVESLWDHTYFNGENGDWRKF